MRIVSATHLRGEAARLRSQLAARARATRRCSTTAASKRLNTRQTAVHARHHARCRTAVKHCSRKRLANTSLDARALTGAPKRGCSSSWATAARESHVRWIAGGRGVGSSGSVVNAEANSPLRLGKIDVTSWALYCAGCPAALCCRLAFTTPSARYLMDGHGCKEGSAAGSATDTPGCRGSLLSGTPARVPLPRCTPAIRRPSSLYTPCSSSTARNPAPFTFRLSADSFLSVERGPALPVPCAASDTSGGDLMNSAQPCAGTGEGWGKGNRVSRGAAGSRLRGRRRVEWLKYSAEGVSGAMNQGCFRSQWRACRVGRRRFACWPAGRSAQQYPKQACRDYGARRRLQRHIAQNGILHVQELGVPSCREPHGGVVLVGYSFVK